MGVVALRPRWASPSENGFGTIAVGPKGVNTRVLAVRLAQTSSRLDGPLPSLHGKGTALSRETPLRSDNRPPGAVRYPLATRLNSFRAGGVDVVTAIRRAAMVPGLTALELNYPQHVEALGEVPLATLLAEVGLPLTGLNLRFEGADFRDGAFTSPRAATRERAVLLATEAVDLAARHGAGHVVLWMADDGFDYPFQVDYARLWADEIDGFRRVAAHDPAVRVSVEYKPNEPRRFSLIRSMGEALLAVRDVDLPNFGVTLDFCHGLMTGEHPAAAASLALRHGRLFGVHLNDGYGSADDGLMVGSVRPCQTLELLAVLVDGGYDGTLYFDTFPVREDPVAECVANVATVSRYLTVLDRLDRSALAAAQADHDAIAVRAPSRRRGVPRKRRLTDAGRRRRRERARRPGRVGRAAAAAWGDAARDGLRDPSRRQGREPGDAGGVERRRLDDDRSGRTRSVRGSSPGRPEDQRGRHDLLSEDPEHPRAPVR